MKFIDYKCQNCDKVSELFLRGDDESQIKCEKCGSSNMEKVFAPVGFRSNFPDSNLSSGSSCSGCPGGDCGTCSR
jgi:putative FmdB family regulatory protein